MGYILALTAVFFWSFNIIIASYFSTTLQPFEIACGRWIVAALILVPLSWKSLRGTLPVLAQHGWLVVALALTGIVWDNTLIYYAGRTASAIDMGLLDITGPIFLVILSKIFFKTPITLQQISGLAIAVLGVITIILNGNFANLRNVNFVVGDGIMLINTFAFALYSLLQARRPAEIPQTTMLAATVVTGLVIMLPFLFTTVAPSALMQLQPIDFGVFIYLGIFNSVISYLSWNTALNKIGNIKTSIIYYLLPVFSGIEAYFFLHEKLYWPQFAGGILIVSGIALVSLKRKAAQ